MTASLSSASLALDGLFAIYKPRGVISKDVSRAIQRQLGKVRIGHVGTLDPMAEGVLPILIGRATRLQDYLLASRKTYQFTIKFGVLTDSLDMDGEILREEQPPELVRATLEPICARLLGTFRQTPPLYSAIKVKGRALYDYARSGKEAPVDLNDLAKDVMIHSLDLIGISGEQATFRLCCSKGTYVRSVAEAIAKEMGTIGTVCWLLREESAGVHMQETIPMEQLLAAGKDMGQFLQPLAALRTGLGRLLVTPEVRERLFQGQRVVLAKDSIAFQGAEMQKDSFLSADFTVEVLLVTQEQEVVGIGLMKAIDQCHALITLKRGLS